MTDPRFIEAIDGDGAPLGAPIADPHDAVDHLTAVNIAHHLTTVSADRAEHEALRAARIIAGEDHAPALAAAALALARRSRS